MSAHGRWSTAAACILGAAMLPLLAVAEVASPHPLEYACHFTSTAPEIDGRLDDRVWARAPWTSDFVDIEGSARPAPRLRTRVKMLWDHHYLYIAAELTEPDVKATLTQHDSVIFHDNDFEVFLKPLPETASYYEFEMNALNTAGICFCQGPIAWVAPPTTAGTSTVFAPRSPFHGTLNNSADRDGGWTLEIAYPLDAFLSRQDVPPPRVGTAWRINFSRVEWTAGQPKENNWVWSPQGVIDMHIPERWGFLHFAK